MEFKEYSEVADSTAIYEGNTITRLSYVCLGLGGETGEVLEKVKKIIRDSHGIVRNGTAEELKKELGDILWYINAICKEVGITLESVAETNLQKLTSRLERGVLQGSGDNR